jgi:hypothetical protein
MLKFLGTMLLSLCMVASAKSKPAALHSKIESKSRILADGTILLQIKILANRGYKLKLNSEWDLNFKKHDGVVIDRISFDQKNFKDNSSFFLIVLGKKNTQQKFGSIDYELSSYVCKTKKLCYKDIHRGYIPWKI